MRRRPIDPDLFRNGVVTEPFRAHLRQRWEAGRRNGRLLFDEIQGLGYTATHKSV
jgi:hypothetical protein